jgi:hypothetical protein
MIAVCAKCPGQVDLPVGIGAVKENVQAGLVKK